LPCSAAYNTYWNIQSSNPDAIYWSEYGTSYPQWGCHMINIIGTGITQKLHAGTAKQPHPYVPANAHLETMAWRLQ